MNSLPLFSKSHLIAPVKLSREYDGFHDSQVQGKHVPPLLTKRDWIIYKWVIEFLQNKEKPP